MPVMLQLSSHEAGPPELLLVRGKQTVSDKIRSMQLTCLQSCWVDNVHVQEARVGDDASSAVLLETWKPYAMALSTAWHTLLQ